MTNGGVEFSAGFGGGAVNEEDSLGVVEFVLNDIFGELDAARRNRLLANLPAGAQTIITTTFLNWAEAHPIERVFRLAEGRLS